jgi:deoxycytidylate deaminase
MEYPYLPEGREIKYVSKDNPFMKEAYKISLGSGCQLQATGAVVVRDGKVVSLGTNVGKLQDICPRAEKKSPTGTDYHLCKEICEQISHAEVAAIRNTEKDLTGTDMYLYGHWWICENCWNEIIKAGIKNVFLQDKSWEEFKITK